MVNLSRLHCDAMIKRIFRRNRFTYPEGWVEYLKKLKVTRVDVNRLVMNFLLAKGYAEAAEKFHLESDTELDVPFLSDCIAIKKAIRRGDMLDAVEKTNALNPEILDENPLLLFHLLNQQLIELIRNGRSNEALDFAGNELRPMVEDNLDFLAELKRTLVLLAFENLSDCPVAVSGLLDISRRRQIANAVNIAINTTQGYKKVTKLEQIVKMLKIMHIHLFLKKCDRSQEMV